MSDAALPPNAAAGRSSALPRRMGLLLAVIAITVLPLIFNDSYWRTNLTICAINVLLALGLDFILGYAGQLNLGHSAFYGLGAYVSTLLIVKLGVPFWAAFVAGVAFSGFAGMFLSLFAVRLRGHYLAIASLGFAVIVHQILLNWIGLTQGPLGIYGIAPPPAIAIPGLPADRFPQPDGVLLSGVGVHAACLCAARPAGALADRRNADRNPRGRNIRRLARHKRRRLEGIRLRRRRGRRRRGRLLLCEFRRHAGAGRVFRHRSLQYPGDGDCRRDGNFDRPGIRRDPFDAAAGSAARHRRSASRRLRRRAHVCRALYARRTGPSRARRARKARFRTAAHDGSRASRKRGLDARAAGAAGTGLAQELRRRTGGG